MKRKMFFYIKIIYFWNQSFLINKHNFKTKVFIDKLNYKHIFRHSFSSMKGQGGKEERLSAVSRTASDGTLSF